MADAHKNFASSAVATAPSPATSGTSLVVASGAGASFPTPPFNVTLWPASAQPTSANAEIARVTAIATDTLTITRAQESSSVRSVVVGDQIAATITAKTLTDAENYQTVQSNGAALTQRPIFNAIGRGFSLLDNSGAGSSELHVFDPLTMFYVQEEFVTGSLTSPTTGALGWQWSGGSTGGTAAVTNHPGIVNRSTGATANTMGAFYLGSAGVSAYDPVAMFDMLWIARMNVLDAETTVRFGFQDNPTNNPPANGIYFERLTTDTDIFGVCRSGAAQVRTVGLTGGALSTTTWYKLRIRRIDASTIGFSVNAGTERTLTTNIPTAASLVVAQVYYNTGGTLGAKNVDYDYWDLLVTGMSR